MHGVGRPGLQRLDQELQPSHRRGPNREATAGWLDVNAMVGNMRNELSTADGPGKAEQIVKARRHQHQ
jgi:hypothetical protein